MTHIITDIIFITPITGTDHIIGTMVGLMDIITDGIIHIIHIQHHIGIIMVDTVGTHIIMDITMDIVTVIIMVTGMDTMMDIIMDLEITTILITITTTTMM